MAPWAAAVITTHYALSAHPKYAARSKLVTCSKYYRSLHIRGRSLNNAFVIIDEAQNLERGMWLLTALSRLGENSRVVLTHDIAQRDNPSCW